MSANLCVCCGAIIPEGRQVCPICERTDTNETFKTKNKTEKEPNKMKDYYETKRRRYQEILAAYDENARGEIMQKITGENWTIIELIDYLTEIEETRDLISSEIKYLDKALDKLKAEEAVKAAEPAAETEAE